MSETVSLLISADQAFEPQWAVASVPADVSTAVREPSQSGALGGTGRPKWPVKAVTSEMSEKVSLVTSAGQALKPHWTRAWVPARSSTAEVKPSQSGSLAGMSQAGRAWLAFGQSGQLSVALGSPS